MNVDILIDNSEYILIDNSEYIFVDSEDTFIDTFTNSNSKKTRISISWAEYFKKTYNVMSIFLAIALVYLYFIFKRPSKAAAKL
jgi:hypothetical protein